LTREFSLAPRFSGLGATRPHPNVRRKTAEAVRAAIVRNYTPLKRCVNEICEPSRSGNPNLRFELAGTFARLLIHFKGKCSKSFGKSRLIRTLADLRRCNFFDIFIHRRFPVPLLFRPAPTIRPTQAIKRKQAKMRTSPTHNLELNPQPRLSFTPTHSARRRAASFRNQPNAR
jgi:hypothetical protein